MDDLIEALQLIATRCKPEFPTWCEHDALHVCVDDELFTPDEIAKLDELGFFVGGEGGFTSFRFGSA
jgi:hypothetical protein